MKKDKTYFTFNISIKKSFIINVWEIIWDIIKAILYVVFAFISVISIVITSILGIIILLNNSITLDNPVVGYIILLTSLIAMIGIINLFKNWEL